MIHQVKSKKILFYFFIFFMIGTFNNKNLDKINFSKKIEIKVNGLDDSNNLILKNDLNNLKIHSLFFLDELKLKEIIVSNNLVEKFNISKQYPSKLNINIKKTILLANVNKDGNNFFLGSNGKLIDAKNIDKNIPTIFGNFDNEKFFELKKALEHSNFEYDEIEKFFYFKSGRWDIELRNGLLIKLPKNSFKDSLKLIQNILYINKKNKITLIDLRQKNQIIINEQ